MKILTIKPADREQENLVVSFLENLHIPFEEDTGTDLQPSAKHKSTNTGNSGKITGDAWRFGT
ncbi:MAG TPA: hypothetical protein VGE26_05230 [Sphingobacteriaceae bacterium]